jgi:small subunit ribosomal protein S17
MSKKTFNGVVTSTKMNKTVVVTVETVKSHSLYDKKIKSSKKFLAHNELDVSEGDVVSIRESKPFSKRVTFEVVQVLKEDK